MAHYAILNENNIVTQVIVGKDENEIVLDDNGNPIDWEKYYGGKRTSYWTFAGEHKNGGIPFRKNYAGVGFFYDENKDAFIPPQPFSSWVLNEVTCLWEAPIAKPIQNEGDIWVWVEEIQNWINKKPISL